MSRSGGLEPCLVLDLERQQDAGDAIVPGHGELDFEGKVFHDVGVRFKGNGTFLNALGGRENGPVAGTDKVPYKIHLNEFVKGQKLGAKISTLDFRNNVTDATSVLLAVPSRERRRGMRCSDRTARADTNPVRLIHS